DEEDRDFVLPDDGTPHHVAADHPEGQDDRGHHQCGGGELEKLIIENGKGPALFYRLGCFVGENRIVPDPDRHHEIALASLRSSAAELVLAPKSFHALCSEMARHLARSSGVRSTTCAPLAA